MEEHEDADGEDSEQLNLDNKNQIFERGIGVDEFQNININSDQFEEKKEESKAEPAVYSEAWPDENIDQIQVKAKVHTIIKERLSSQGVDMTKSYFRPLDEGDVEEVKSLHQEWFPLTYGEGFYKRIANKSIITIGCFYDIEVKQKKKNKKQSVILGVILVRIQQDNEDVNEIFKAKDQSAGITGWLSSIILCKQYQGAYIMTIGVIDECRRYGLGTMLLREVTKIINMEYPTCEVLYLHVVDYNEAAIRFYEKNKFSTLKRIKNHYVIFNKHYDALVLYKDIKLNLDLQNDNEQPDNRKLTPEAQLEGNGYFSSFIGSPFRYLKSLVFRTQ